MRILPLVTASLLLGLCSAGCSFVWRSVTGSGHELRQTRDVAPFSAVVVASSLEAEITLDPDQPQSVEIRGDDNLVPLVRARVSSGELVLDLPPSLGIDPRLPLVVTIHATALSALATQDSARAGANAVEGGAVRIASSDSSELTVGRVAAESSLSVESSDSSSSAIGEAAVHGRVAVSSSDSSVLEMSQLVADDEVALEASDSSEVSLRGEAPALDATLSDSSALDAADLTVESVVVRASSSSTAEVCATETLDATLSDSSSVRYGCDPESVTQHLEDSASLEEG